MNALPRPAVFHRSIYRDFALLALAALGVGLAVSLMLATAIVLATPNRSNLGNDDETTKSQRPLNSNSISKVKQGGDERATKTVHTHGLGASEEANAVSPMKWDWNKTRLALAPYNSPVIVSLA